MILEIIYENDDLIAINKPHGLLVHKSKIAANADEFALQILRDQIGQKVNLCHRLDRKTSGVLLFAKNKESNALINILFTERKTEKVYKAIVRGYTEDSGTINYAIAEDDKPLQDAVTHYTCLERFEIPLPHGHFQTSRYSLIEVKPETGRFHQIRKHMSHLRHPILGDRPHGCNKQNRLWKSTFDMTTMLLHAEQLSFVHPNYGQVNLRANCSEEFEKALTMLRSQNTS